MTGFALFLAGSALAYGLARWLHLPIIPLLLLTGIGLAWSDAPLPDFLLRNGVELGLVFLVFTAGIELNPRRAGGRLRAVLLVGISQFVLLGACTYAAALLLGYDPLTSLFLASAVAASSTLVVVRCLKQRQQMFEPFGRLVTGVLLLQDLFIIFLVVFLARLPEGVESALTGVAGGLVLGLLAFAAQRWATPFLLLRLKLEEEQLLLSVLGILFFFIGLATLFGLPLIAGAFLAGFSLSSFPVSGLIRGMLLSLTDFFLAFFFVGLGALIVIPPPEFLFDGLIFAVLLYAVTVPLVAFAAEANGFSSRAAIESGLLLSQTSEFSLIIALQGWLSGQISHEVFSLITILSVATMTVTPFVATDGMTWRLMRFHPMRRRRKGSGRLWTGHVLLLGLGSAGLRIVSALVEGGQKVVVIDDDASVARRLRRRGIECLLGDGSDPHSLDLVNAREARLVISSLRRQSDAEKMLHYFRDSKPEVLLRVFDRATSDRIRHLGGIPILAPENSIEILLRWMEENHILNSGTEPDPVGDTLPEPPAFRP